MTGREIIVFILENHLEDMEFNPTGYITAEKYAENHNVGIATVMAWIEMGSVLAVKFGKTYYIPC